MAIAIRVEAAVVGRRRAGVAEQSLTVDLAADATLRDLIATVVATEVEAYDRRRDERTFVSVLTERALAEGVERGAVRSGGTEGAAVGAAVGAAEGAAAAPPLGDAVAAALLAFTDGLFQVYVNDEPVDSLDEMVHVHDGTRLLFLRLVALAGG